MGLKIKISSFKSVLFFGIIILCIHPATGQQTPEYPVSYRIFTPFVLNPAIAGSKDFSSVDFISAWRGKSGSQILSANSRLITKSQGYVMSPNMKKFSSFGIGGYLFNENTSPYRNLGISAAVSYQIPLDRQSLSYLSYGVAVKGVYNIMDSIPSSEPGSVIPGKKIFYPNLDFGIYYYGPSLFAGVSATNLLGNPEDPDSLGVYRLPVSRRYLFIAGYKIILSGTYDIVLEPSFMLNWDGAPYQKFTNLVKPMLKLYMQGFCLGTYFNNYDNISFFLQYKYPVFYLGTFFEIPRNSPFFKKNLNVEFTVGLNFSPIKSRSSKYYHW
jgi:type IX secretion system PorP/SprF family membrane protein